MGSVMLSEKHEDPRISNDDEGYSSEDHVTQQLLAKEKGFGMPDVIDIEQQRAAQQNVSGKHAAEYSVPARTKYIYLGLYFGLNLGLTLFNKAVLGKVCQISQSHLRRSS